MWILSLMILTWSFYFQIRSLLWTLLCPLQISYIETPTPSVTVFGDWTFKEELRLNEVTSVGL